MNLPPDAEERLTGANCQWPKCPEKSQIKISVPMFELTESGGYVRSSTEGIKVILPFCMYHGVISGNGQFGVAKEGGGPNYNFVGPVHLISLIESVMGARETTKIQQPRNKKEVAKIKKKKGNKNAK
jgi:hypothetical protein